MERVKLIDHTLEKPFQLNEGQELAVAMARECADNGQSMSLVGQAGSGKSTVTKAILDAYDDMGVTYALTAMTHKACAIVKEKTGRECRTTHSTLCLSPTIDYKTGRESLKRRKGEMPMFGTLLVTDEASMSCSEMHKFMSSYQNLNIGDAYQLPPINEPLSPSLFLDNKTKLTQVMRHDNEILDLATELCACVKTGAPLPKFESRGAVHVVGRRDFNEELYTSLEDSVESAVYLAWTNAATESMTAKVRRNVFRRDRYIPIVGETMVSNTALIDPDEDCVLLANNVEVTVLSVEQKEFSVDGNIIAGYTIQVESDQPCISEIDVATDKSALARMLANKRQEALKLRTRHGWYELAVLKSLFADMRFTYSATVHKSQGSTYPKVFVDLPDIMKNRDADTLARLLYVAASRPSQELYILK